RKPPYAGGGSGTPIVALCTVAPMLPRDTSSNSGYRGTAVSLSRSSVPFLLYCTFPPTTATRNTSPAAYGVSPPDWYTPFSRTSAQPPPLNRKAKSISPNDVSSLPWLSPALQKVFVSPTVNSTKPSPEAIVCSDVAPASSHPSQPAVFCRTSPV